MKMIQRRITTRFRLVTGLWHLRLDLFILYLCHKIRSESHFYKVNFNQRTATFLSFFYVDLRIREVKMVGKT